MSRTLSGLFLVGALNRPRKRKRTNRENPRRVPGQIGKIPEKSGKSQKGQKSKDKSRSGTPLDFSILRSVSNRTIRFASDSNRWQVAIRIARTETSKGSRDSDLCVAGQGFLNLSPSPPQFGSLQSGARSHPWRWHVLFGQGMRENPVLPFLVLLGRYNPCQIRNPPPIN